MHIRTRIAPSPTGEDLHIGNIYTGLLNWAFANKNKGQFIIRIEDTDRTRLVRGSEQRILNSLKNFGLNYDEGPDIGGPYAPYRQSERKDLYNKYAIELVEKGAAYYCFCTKEKLEEIKSKDKKIGDIKRHISFCQILKTSQVKEKIANNEAFVIRLKVPDNTDISFEDLIRGKITINTRQIDDQILIKSDGFPTYHLGVVVDDHLMKISHVIRAEEWISSTPKHILLYQAFGWELPVFVHVPLLRNTDKSKLSKRQHPVWASWYLQEGYLAEAILNYLALMGWSHPEGKEIFPIKEFIEKFELKDINPVGPVFDIRKLEWMNGEYLRKMSDDELEKRLEGYLVDHPGKGKITPLIPLIKERIKKLSDFIPLTDFFFEKVEYDREVLDKLKIETLDQVLSEILKSLEQMKQPWDSGIFEETFRKLAQAEKISVSQMFQLIRVAVSGQLVTPPLFESIKILGEENTIKRIKETILFVKSSSKLHN